mgnify:CR=1 FL=1
MNGSNMENEKTPLYVAFSTQKGGVGKTTFTVLAASYLYYLKGYDVAVVDSPTLHCRDAKAGCRAGRGG